MARARAKPKRERGLKVDDLTDTSLGNTTFEAIIELIERGFWDETAAEACGVDLDTWESWMARGRAGEPPYRNFYRAVRQAKAMARGWAEANLKINRPDLWLREGPGQAEPGRPGWRSANAKSNVQGEKKLNLNQIDEVNDSFTIEEEPLAIGPGPD